MAFVATTDAAKARDFYGTKLGFALKSDEPFALVFDAGGTILRVQKAETVAAAKYTVLGWRVTDIAAAILGLAERGVVFEKFAWMPPDPLGIWTAPDGTRVAWFKDPDGNILSLTQF